MSKEIKPCPPERTEEEIIEAIKAAVLDPDYQPPPPARSDDPVKWHCY